uniref:CitMHS domain-containing protein n=1 Tax=Angiostrongylus cantonensis TaxID=6313 RepID=A0A158PBA3_ANGCA
MPMWGIRAKVVKEVQEPSYISTLLQGMQASRLQQPGEMLSKKQAVIETFIKIVKKKTKNGFPKELKTAKSSDEKRSNEQTTVKSSDRKESHDRTNLRSTTDVETQGGTNAEEDEVTGCKILPHLLRKWKMALVLLLTPLIFSPLVISEKKELRCAFCVCLMGVYWMTETLPLAITAVIPVVLFPLTGVMTCKAVAQQFFNDTNFLYISGIIVALAIEKCFLHRRIALFVLNMVGSDPKFMFISNTATTAMMVPLSHTLINELVSCYNTRTVSREIQKGWKNMSIGLVLCICISSNIGGTGTITGTPTNLVLAGQLSELFGSEVTMDYVTWFLFAFPLMCLYTTSAMIVALLLFALPSESPNLSDYRKKEIREVPRLMDWNTIQKRFPWDVVLLLGGGFALAAGVKDSGLAKLIGSFLSKGGNLPLWVLQLLTMLITTAVTNFCSNVATTTIFAPIVATLAVEIKTHPLNLMLPVTIIASFAFILPVGTPPNAIVFSTGMVTVGDMAISGTVISGACIVITMLYMKTIASVLMPLSEFPVWAQPLNSSINM